MIIECAERGHTKDLYENTFDKLGLQYEFNLTQDIINGFSPSSNLEYTDQKTGEKKYTVSITDPPDYLDPIIEKDFRQTFDKFITFSERKYGKKPVRTLIEIVKRYWFDNAVDSFDDDLLEYGTIELGGLNLAKIAKSS